MIVSICILSSGDYWRERLVIERAMRNALDMEFEILIHECSDEPRLVPFVDSLMETNEKGETSSKQYPSLKKTATDYTTTRNRDFAMYNKLFQHSKGDYFCMLGNNAFVSRGWLHDMVAVIERVNDVGLVSLEHALSPINLFNILDQNGEPVMVRRVNSNKFTGAAMFNKKVYDVFGGFDERAQGDGNDFYSKFFEELKKNGLNNVSVPEQFLIHT